MLCTRCGTMIKEGSTVCSYCKTPVSDSIPDYSGQPIMQSVPAHLITQRNRIATVGLIFGIISIVLSLSPALSISSNDSTLGSMISAYSIIVILGIIFSSIGMKRGRTYGGRSKATTGLILSIISFAMLILSIGLRA